MTLTSIRPRARASSQRVVLVRPPFFSPMAPPLGMAMLKAFVEQHGHRVACVDLNIDPVLWDTQHGYFRTLRAPGDGGAHDGHSKLWSLINAHMQAFVAGADAAACRRVVEQLAPLFGMQVERAQAEALHGLVVAFFDRLAARLDEIELADCALVGTSTYTTSLAPSLFALRRLKRRRPDVRTVMGGGVFADDLALGSENLATLLREYPEVDHVVLGEGEPLLLRLAQGELADRRVITLGDGGAGAVPFAELPTPDFSDFEVDSYFHLTIEGGRSCPFQCSFCSETIQWGEYRKKPAARLAEQMLALAARHGNPRFFLGDSLINPYISSLSKELLQRDARIAYDGYLRADKPVADRARVAEWARSGLYRARLGIETAAPRVLEIMGKMTSPDVVLAVLRSLAAAGVRTTTYWVAGHPGETEDDFQTTLAFVREAHPFIYELEVHPFYYYPYGQVASRLYEAVAPLPPEVVDATKFAIWDPAGVEPTRAERFDRLRRFAQVAAEVGIPHIYTMAERYAAEERWRRLAPAAKEIY